MLKASSLCRTRVCPGRRAVSLFLQSTVYLGEEIFIFLSSHEFSLLEILLLGTYRGGQFVC